MNEFISQFILESREYIEQASSGLALLERTPHDAETLDAVFRAFHTLKGGASIVDFGAMERAVHAAEDVLSRARSGKAPLTRDLIDGCMSCLDQASRWLDAMEVSGELPVAADGDASHVIDLIGRATHTDEHESTVAPTPRESWAEAALHNSADVGHRARTAVRFTPRPESFFEGVDPLALIAGLPEPLWIDATPTDGWPTLEELDPFASMLVITALSAATADGVRRHLAEHVRECEIVSLQPRASALDSHSDLPESARRLIEAQLDLLSPAQTPPGIMESAGVVVVNVLRYCRRNPAAEVVRAAIRESLRDGNPESLRRSIAAVIAPQAPVPSAALQATSHQETPAARTLRVDVERVDTLVRLASELTVVKNAIGHVVTLAQTGEGLVSGMLKEHHAALDRLVGELQRAALVLRVLPMRTVFQRFPRLVREMSAQLRKPTTLAIEGEETEADKAIVEALFEPLLHIVRNAMDHGVEEPHLRQQRGKPPVATIRMRASRDGANVLVEITDDGAGIDLARVRKVAQEKAIATAESLSGMPNSSLLELVFAPGFSTAAGVTGFSGRGVGMDAVRTAVESIGGRVALDSRAGDGTSVTLTLPFSMMMAHVMTVEAGGQMFGITLDAVVETIRVPADAVTGIGAAKAIVHRDRTVPLVELANVLRVQEVSHAQPEVTVVIVSAGGHLSGIQVDRVGERMEVMLKQLDGLLSDIPGLIGTTILGDGRVLLVLDLRGVLQ